MDRVLEHALKKRFKDFYLKAKALTVLHVPYLLENNQVSQESRLPPRARCVRHPGRPALKIFYFEIYPQVAGGLDDCDAHATCFNTEGSFRFSEPQPNPTLLCTP